MSQIERERMEMARSEEAPCSGLLSTVVFWQQGCYWVRHDKLMGQVWGTGQDRTDGGSPGVSVRTGCGSAEPPIPSRLVGRGKGEPSRQELSCVLSPELTFLSSARL